MMRLRCTKGLLGYYAERPTAVSLAVDSEPLHGDRYANLIRYADTDIALCVTGQTRYANVIPLDGCESLSTFYIRLVQRTSAALRRVGRSWAAVGQELGVGEGTVRRAAHSPAKNPAAAASLSASEHAAD